MCADTNCVTGCPVAESQAADFRQVRIHARNFDISISENLDACRDREDRTPLSFYLTTLKPLKGLLLVRSSSQIWMLIAFYLAHSTESKRKYSARSFVSA